MGSVTTDRKNRIAYVDRLRGMAVVAMFFVHSGVAWLDPTLKGSAYWTVISRVSGMVAPTFMFLAGLSVALVAHAGRRAGRDQAVLRRNIVLRGLKILALGYALHLSFFIFSGLNGPLYRVVKVDILHCIGLGLAVIPLLAWPSGRFNGRALAIFIGLPILSLITYRLPLSTWVPDGLAAYVSTQPRLALFPFVPYAAWIALGIFVGGYWAPVAYDNKSDRRFWVGLLIGAVLFNFASLGVKWAYYHFQLHELGVETRPTRGLVHYFFFKAAWVFVIFAAVRAINPLFQRIRFSGFVRFGRTSLFAYVVHLYFVYHVGGPGIVRSLTPSQHLLGTLILTLVMFALVLAWQQRSQLQLGWAWIAGRVKNRRV